jgi:hypothetical protein
MENLRTNSGLTGNDGVVEPSRKYKNLSIKIKADNFEAFDRMSGAVAPYSVPMSETQQDIGSKTESHPTKLDRETAQTEEINIGIDGAFEFILFPKLPIEIRLQIWEEALPPTRYLEIRNTGKWSWSLNQPAIHICCKEKAPSLFFVCRESRAEVAKRYDPLQGTTWNSPVFYCDFKKDVLAFNYGYFAYGLTVFLQSIPRRIASKITRIALCVEFLMEDGWGLEKKNYAGLSGLKEALVDLDTDSPRSHIPAGLLSFKPLQEGSRAIWLRHQYGFPTSRYSAAATE